MKSSQQLPFSFASLVLIVQCTGSPVFMADAKSVGTLLFESIARHENGEMNAASIEEVILSVDVIKKALSHGKIREIIESTESQELKKILSDDSEIFNDSFLAIGKDNAGKISFKEWMSVLKVYLSEL